MNIYEREVIGVTINELKDEIVGNVNEYVTDTAKSAFLVWVSAKVLPAAREMAEAYIAAIKESGANETGWCKARDTLIIPAVISIGLWVIEESISKVAEIK